MKRDINRRIDRDLMCPDCTADLGEDALNRAGHPARIYRCPRCDAEWAEETQLERLMFRVLDVCMTRLHTRHVLASVFAVLLGLIVANLHQSYGWPALAAAVPFTALAVWDTATSRIDDTDEETEDTPS